MTRTSCKHCGHSKADHKGYWANGEIIPGKLCYWAENQGYQEDLCPCLGFNAKQGLSYFETLLIKAGIT